MTSPSLLLRRRIGMAGSAATAALLVLALTACSGGAEPAAAPTGDGGQDWPRTIQTDDGELTIAAPPKRIVSTSTTLTGSLLAVGAPVVASAATVPDVPGLSDEKGFFSQWSDEAEAADVQKLYENSSPSIEKAVEYDPDLIVVAKNGGDSVIDSVDQLRKIAPVLVVDYSGAAWQDVTRTIGEATGHEAEAEKVVADFDSHLATAKGEIALPSGDTSAFIVFGDGSGAAAFTDQAPQVQVMKELGFTMAPIPDAVTGDTSMGADRKDIVNLSMENIQKGLPGKNWIVVSADDKTRTEVTQNPAFSTSPAVTAGKVSYTPGETFRLDYYSATMLVNSLRDSFAGDR